MSLPYTIQVKLIKEGSGDYYFATAAELDGCKRKTLAVAYERLREDGWLIPLLCCILLSIHEP
ncbi:hypothetical protein J15TS10_30570 [Paenibacillus woosongensis]|uniref:Uncharacterized protein n=1 Tax=Paenibacillus woosongensis TaxID=307580 RepID=A0ABQ4MTI2_9BACL|nr:hypothetical protein J15TS10_30570 [Paenibacillus woosongensis]